MTTKKHDDDEPNAAAAQQGGSETGHHLDPSRQAGAAPRAAEAPPAPFPFSHSINEPQTVSLPIPQGTVVPKPAITGYDPYECAIGDPDFTLYVTGENFFADSVIFFAGHDEPTTLGEDGRLSTGVKPSLWADPVVVQMQIRNGPEISAPVEFEFTAPATRSATRKR
jgi:hypothetical protein